MSEQLLEQPPVDTEVETAEEVADADGRRVYLLQRGTFTHAERGKPERNWPAIDPRVAQVKRGAPGTLTALREYQGTAFATHAVRSHTGRSREGLVAGMVPIAAGTAYCNAFPEGAGASTQDQPSYRVFRLPRIDRMAEMPSQQDLVDAAGVSFGLSGIGTGRQLAKLAFHPRALRDPDVDRNVGEDQFGGAILLQLASHEQYEALREAEADGPEAIQEAVYAAAEAVVTSTQRFIGRSSGLELPTFALTQNIGSDSFASMAEASPHTFLDSVRERL